VGPKLNALNGSNFLGTTIGSLIEMTGNGFTKGYNHWKRLYRGKKRDYHTPFSVFGKGFDIVCHAILDLNLRYQGLFVIAGILQCLYCFSYVIGEFTIWEA